MLLVYDDGLCFLAVLLGHLGGRLVELLLQRLSGGRGFHPFLLIQRLQSKIELKGLIFLGGVARRLRLA